LARRVTGRARVGARIAFGGAALQLAVYAAQLGVVLYHVVEDESSIAWGIPLYSANTVGLILIMVGLGIAARRWYLGLVGAVVALVTEPPWFVVEWMFESFDHTTFSIVLNGFTLLSTITMFVLAVIACRDASKDAEPPRVRSGLRGAAFALCGQAIATAVVVALMLLQQNNQEASCRLAIVVATFVGFASLTMIALSLLDVIRNRLELPAWLLVGSAAALLCVAGRTMLRVLDLAYEYFWQPPTTMSFDRVSFLGPREPTFMPAISAQVITACAIGGLLVAIAIAARRRGLDALRGLTIASVAVFVVLALGAIAAQQVIVDLGRLEGGNEFILIGANALLVASWLIAARMARSAAIALTGGASLPAARIVR
jgi:hypothetical protein